VTTCGAHGAATARDTATGTIAVGTGNYVFAVHADGGGGHALGAGDYPAFSSNGRLAFTLNGVWVARADGTERRHIVPPFADYITYTDPTWAPNGQHIAYVRVDNGHETSELWIVRADGADLHGLSIVHQADMPAWSPQGKWIAYVGDGGLSEVLADGTGKRLLLRRDVASPTWSPDGGRIAFEQQAGGQVSTWILSTGTGKLRLLERHRGAAGPLAWSPDGRLIAFTRQRANSAGSFFEIRTVDVATGTQAVVTRLFVQRVDGLTWRRSRR
jgi:Tol biopolymer transport system component